MTGTIAGTLASDTRVSLTTEGTIGDSKNFGRAGNGEAVRLGSSVCFKVRHISDGGRISYKALPFRAFDGHQNLPSDLG